MAIFHETESRVERTKRILAKGSSTGCLPCIDLTRVTPFLNDGRFNTAPAGALSGRFCTLFDASRPLGGGTPRPAPQPLRERRAFPSPLSFRLSRRRCPGSAYPHLLFSMVARCLPWLLCRLKGQFFYRMVLGVLPQWIRTYPEDAAPRTGEGLFPGEVIEVDQVFIVVVVVVVFSPQHSGRSLLFSCSSSF